MTTAKNDVFIGIELENFYLEGGELTFGGEGIRNLLEGRNFSR